MAREFSVGGENLTIANAAATLVSIMPTAAPNPLIRMMRMWASQSGSTTSAQYRIQAVTQVTAFPTVVSATPRPLKHADATISIIAGATTIAAGKCGINASAEGAGTKTMMWGDNFNNINGFLWVPTPDEQVEMPAGDASTFSLYAPAAFTGNLSGWAVGINFAER